MFQIRVEDAYQGNLKHISLDIPKNKLVVFSGLSGSGKSTLLVDTVFHECQRQYLEALAMEGIHKPMVARIRGASPAIMIAQGGSPKNPRSTVGTLSDIYTDLRMVYEKIGNRPCPFCGKAISAGDCKEETEKHGSEFFVYMYCKECGKRMDKIMRTHFSFNTTQGACITCEGLGKVHQIDQEKVVDKSLSLEQGAVRYWEKQYAEYQIKVFYAALQYFGIPVILGTPVNAYSEVQKAILFEGVTCELRKELFPERNLPKTVAMGRFEGVYPILWRRYAERNGEAKQLKAYIRTEVCSVCEGERLGELARSVLVQGIRLPQLANYSLDHLVEWTTQLRRSLSPQHEELVHAYLVDIDTKLKRFCQLGLGYLTLERQMITLSGGEMQRLRLAAVLDSELTGVIYILDEPTVGLHPRDTAGLLAVLKRLRDMGNSVLIIEHDVDVMEEADYIIDMGPGAGQHGGEVVAVGSFQELLKQEMSITGDYFRNPQKGKNTFRKGNGEDIQIMNANKYNLKNLTVSIPTGCLTAITGPSGSGKSTLVFEVLANGTEGESVNGVAGLSQFDVLIQVEQASIAKMKRSNIATYATCYSEIRTLFAKTQAAKDAGLTAKHFSFNTAGGRCENCEGLGYIDSNMLFFQNIEVLCPVCGGKRFKEEVLSITYEGLSIHDVLKLSVEEAQAYFGKHPKLAAILNLLEEVGLGYLELGQTLTTLSGGEAQRLKLAKELIGAEGKQNLYLMDEPTTGLHPKDIEHFLNLVNRLVDAGNTVVVVEHNRQMILQCDWMIDLGPEGGEKGGRLLYEGVPR